MEMRALFDGFDPSTHDEEVHDRWGGTDAYLESQRRTKGYTGEDWKRQRAEQTSIYADLAAAMQSGAAPSDDRVMDIAERHRLSIDRWFYPCSLATHRGLADMYENDARFAASIDQHGEGLTTFFAAAIRANAGREVGGDRS